MMSKIFYYSIPVHFSVKYRRVSNLVDKYMHSKYLETRINTVFFYMPELKFCQLKWAIFETRRNILALGKRKC